MVIWGLWWKLRSRWNWCGRWLCRHVCFCWITF